MPDTISVSYPAKSVAPSRSEKFYTKFTVLYIPPPYNNKLHILPGYVYRQPTRISYVQYTISTEKNEWVLLSRVLSLTGSSRHQGPIFCKTQDLSYAN